MSKIAYPLALLAAVLVCLLQAAPARAQAARTFVSVAGSDSNPCSIAAPCRHFQAAVTATSLDGEVVALDPANYGSFTISQGITIEGQGWSYLSPPANGNAITINAGTNDTVKIHGVSLNGGGAGGTTSGIVFNTGRTLIVADCVAENFSLDGLLMAPTGIAMAFTITNTSVSNNYAGIQYGPPSGSTKTVGVIDHVVANNNTAFGIQFSYTTGGPTTVAISNSSASGNFTDGIALGNGSNPLTVWIDNTIVVGNGDYGVQAQNSTNVFLGRLVITGNDFGLQTSASTYSYQNNSIVNNTTLNVQGDLQLLQPQ